MVAARFGGVCSAARAVPAVDHLEARLTVFAVVAMVCVPGDCRGQLRICGAANGGGPAAVQRRAVAVATAAQLRRIRPVPPVRVPGTCVCVFEQRTHPRSVPKGTAETIGRNMANTCGRGHSIIVQPSSNARPWESYSVSLVLVAPDICEFRPNNSLAGNSQVYRVLHVGVTDRRAVWAVRVVLHEPRVAV